jgi:hypothetical protein
MIFSVVIVALIRLFLGSSHTQVDAGYKLIAARRQLGFLSLDHNRQIQTAGSIVMLANIVLPWWGKDFGQN